MSDDERMTRRAFIAGPVKTTVVGAVTGGVLGTLSNGPKHKRGERIAGGVVAGAIVGAGVGAVTSKPAAEIKREAEDDDATGRDWQHEMDRQRRNDKAQRGGRGE